MKKVGQSAYGRFNESYATMDALVKHWRLLAQAASAPFGWTDPETHHKQLCRLMDCTHNFWRINPEKNARGDVAGKSMFYNDVNDRYQSVASLTNPDDVMAEKRMSPRSSPPRLISRYVLGSACMHHSRPGIHDLARAPSRSDGVSHA